MKLLFILCLVIFYAELLNGNKDKKKEEPKCEEILVRDKKHRKEILGKGLNRPYQLAYDQSNHSVFFSYNTGNDQEDTFAIGYVEMNQIEHKAIKNIENGFSIAIDNKDNVIYYGGSGGIYKQHLKGKDNEIKHLIDNHNIWDMFYRNHLYFINYPSLHLYKYINGTTVKREQHIHEKIFQFVIDGSDDIFITNETGLFHIKNGTNDRVHYNGTKIFRSIEVNNQGIAYFAGQNGIYTAHKHNSSLDKIAHVKNIFGLTFDDKDNIIYSDPHEIIKLIPGECPTPKKW